MTLVAAPVPTQSSGGSPMGQIGFANAASKPDKLIRYSLSVGLWLAVCPLLTLVGCGGHAARTQDVRSALDAGNPRKALQEVNDALDVEGAKELPKKVSGDNALLLLDRAMILQAIGSIVDTTGTPKEYQWSSRDLETADKQVEVLDLSRNAADEIGRYLFSDSSGRYKAPAYEKLMINTMNMLNYLVRGDLNGARIEARRLAVMQRFIDEHEGHGQSLTGPGSYLAGFIFEKSGEPQQALRYYDQALEQTDLRSLHEPITRLARRASYRSPRINKILDANPPAAESADSAAESADSAAEPAEILVIVQFGRVPAKRAKRIPIGLALTYASGIISPTDASKANYLAAQGLVTWVNFPELAEPRGEYSRPSFALDGEWQMLEAALAVDRQARAAWEKAKGAVVASAITRMIARILAGEAVRRGTGGGLLGALASLGTQATLTAVDTPDTRSWSTLPARIAIGRVRVPPGTHWIDLEARGIRKRERVILRSGGWAVVNLTVLR